MSDVDYNDSDLASAGYWRVYYGSGFPPDGPFDTIAELARETGLYGYPDDGYIVCRDADGSMGSVPSLNPDDLLQIELAPGAEAEYRKFYAVPDFEEVDRSLVAEWWNELR